MLDTADPTWGDILEHCFKAQSSKLELERLFSLKRGTRDVRALSFELSKMSPQVGLAALKMPHIQVSWSRFCPADFPHVASRPRSDHRCVKMRDRFANQSA